MLTREQMAKILNRGESVLYHGQHITRIEDLPPAEKIHADEPEELRRLLNARESQIAALTKERDSLAAALNDAEARAAAKVEPEPAKAETKAKK